METRTRSLEEMSCERTRLPPDDLPLSSSLPVSYILYRLRGQDLRQKKLEQQTHLYFHAYQPFYTPLRGGDMDKQSTSEFFMSYPTFNTHPCVSSNVCLIAP